MPDETESQESPQFSITLPVEALEMIENGLKHFGLYGKPRATICRALILDMLKTPVVQDQVQKGRDKARAIR
jgi:hypothetical protein